MGAALCSLLAQPSFAQTAAAGEAESFFQKIRSSVVLVRLQKQLSGSESPDGLRQVLMNGALVDTRFRPNVVKVIQSHGIAYDHNGRVVSYLGYRWLALNPHDPGVQIDLVRSDGLTSRAKLVGVDQRAGTVVLQAAPDLALQSQGVARITDTEYPEGAQKRPFFLVDLDSRETVRKVALNHVFKRSGILKGTSGFAFVGEPRVSQGQLVFTRDGQFLGFVSGGEPGAAASGPEGVASAERAFVDVDKVISTGQDIPGGWLGLFVEARSAGSANNGIAVREVVAGGPAGISGIRPGDLLLKLQGQELNDVPDFFRFVRMLQVGSKLQFQVQRGSVVNAMAVQVVARPDVPEPGQSTLYLRVAPGSAESAAPQIELSEVQMTDRPTGEVSALVAPPRLGFVGDDLTPQLGNFFGVEGGRGVLIISVAPGSLAERHGLRAGDVIVSLNDDPAGNQLNFLRILERHAGDATWNIRLMRERKPVEVKIRLRAASEGK